MTLAYIVRCNFNRADLEKSWNDWYGGPKLKKMLDKPHFVSVQRFRRASGEGRTYLAFWVLDSQNAFETSEYKNDWGFFEWRPYIIDWSRDLFESPENAVRSPVVGPEQALRLISFEGLDADAAATAMTEVDARLPGVRWMRSVGLDQHTQTIGYAVTNFDAAFTPLGVKGAVDGLYQPISELVYADRAKAGRF